MLCKTTTILLATITFAAESIFMTHVHAQQPPAPPLVQQLNNGNWLPRAEAEALRDELYYQRAVFAYMTLLPVLSTIGLRDGSEATFGKGYNVLPIWKDRMDSRAWVPTPNADVIDELSRLEEDRPARCRCAARRHRHVHRFLPAHDHRCRGDRP
jgi:hypothetical protein